MRVCLCLAMALTGADQPLPSARPALSPVVAKLQGEWAFSSMQGGDAPLGVPVYRLCFNPDQYTLDLRMPGQEVVEHRVYTYMLIPHTSPQAFVVWQDRKAEPYVHGIMRVTDEKLERVYTSVDNPRPTSFEHLPLEYEVYRTVHVRHKPAASQDTAQLH